MRREETDPPLRTDISLPDLMNATVCSMIKTSVRFAVIYVVSCGSQDHRESIEDRFGRPSGVKRRHRNEVCAVVHLLSVVNGAGETTV